MDRNSACGDVVCASIIAVSRQCRLLIGLGAHAISDCPVLLAPPDVGTGAHPPSAQHHGCITGPNTLSELSAPRCLCRMQVCLGSARGADYALS